MRPELCNEPPDKKFPLHETSPKVEMAEVTKATRAAKEPSAKFYYKDLLL